MTFRAHFLFLYWLDCPFLCEGEGCKPTPAKVFFSFSSGWVERDWIEPVAIGDVQCTVCCLPPWGLSQEDTWHGPSKYACNDRMTSSRRFESMPRSLSYPSARCPGDAVRPASLTSSNGSEGEREGEMLLLLLLLGVGLHPSSSHTYTKSCHSFKYLIQERERNEEQRENTETKR